MFSLLAITLAASSIALSRAQVIPTGPAPQADFPEGTPCLITWTPDPASDPKPWGTSYIELMTGDNINMIHLTTVTNFTGTDTSTTSFTWTCPKVTLHSAVYFYQFTSTGTDSPQWTGRFSISDAGKTTPPPNATQPDGSAKPWGIGALADPSSATPPPPTSPEFTPGTPGSTSASGSASQSNPAQPTTPSTTPSGTTTSPKSTGTGTSSPSSNTSSSSISSASTGSPSSGAVIGAALPAGALVAAVFLAALAVL